MKRHWLQVAIAVALWVPSANAAEPRPADSAGQVAAILGGMHVQRSSRDVALRIGDDLYVGDRLRTLSGDRAKIVLADDAVIDLGSNTELVIESRHTQAETGEGESVLSLTAGRIRAIAPRTEGGPRRFEVETPAAVAFRGGDFVISYDTAAQISQVVALDGSISVAGKLGVVGGVVDVEPGFVTEVRKGRRPGTPQETDAADSERLVQSTAMLGTGRQDGLEVLHPALNGRLLSSADVPRWRMAFGLRLGTPEEFLAEQLSADVRTNTQPLLEYKRRNPGSPSATGVEVDF